MAVSIAEVKAYMHAEGEADSVIASYIAMARGYLSGAGVHEPASPAETYALAVKALALHYYDNRGGGELPPGLQGLITQLQYTKTEANR